MTALRRLSPVNALLLLALAVLARALVPTGWMPVAHAGELKIMICSDGSGGAVTVDLGTGPAPQPPRDPCPFAVGSAGAAAVPGAVVPELPTLNWPDTPAFAAPHAARLVAWRSARPPARGPPSFA